MNKIVIALPGKRLRTRNRTADRLTNHEEKRKIGFVGHIDGMDVLKVSAKRLPANFGFMIAHPCATAAPTKLESYKIHQDPPGISGSLVEGRICYDAFILRNKKKAIYYREFATE